MAALLGVNTKFLSGTCVSCSREAATRQPGGTNINPEVSSHRVLRERRSRLARRALHSGRGLSTVNNQIRRKI